MNHPSAGVPRVAALLILGFLFAKLAHADVLTKPDEIRAAVSAGREGAWLDKSALGKCLVAIEEAESLRGTLRIKEEIIASHADSERVWSEQLRLSRTETETWMARFDNEKRLRLSLEAELNLWYHNPLITVPGSLILGGLVGAVGWETIR